MENTNHPYENKEVWLLMEEWKKNVDLYIDQDKRGLQRIQIFLTIHAGLLVLCGILWKGESSVWSLLAFWLIVIGACLFTYITHRMSIKAHAFILLRKIQGMLIEKKIKELLNIDKWQTSEGIVTTFTREHVSFKGDTFKETTEYSDLTQEENNEGLKEAKKRWQLIKEVKKMGKYISDLVTSQGDKFGKDKTMTHLDWLKMLYKGLLVLWLLLGLLSTYRYIWGVFLRLMEAFEFNNDCAFFYKMCKAI
jgi:hypothetical protein